MPGSRESPTAQEIRDALQDKADHRPTAISIAEGIRKETLLDECSNSRAVVEIGPFRFGGVLAWFAWLALHITVLIGFRNRISVFVSWIYGYVFFRRGSRLITRSYDKSGRPVQSTLNSPAASPKQ